MALNETICVLGSEPSDIETLNLGKWVGSLIAIGLILVAVVGFVIRGLFVYYLTYEAQKDLYVRLNGLKTFYLFFLITTPGCVNISDHGLGLFIYLFKVFYLKWQ